MIYLSLVSPLPPAQENFHVWLLFDRMAAEPSLNIFRSLSAPQAGSAATARPAINKVF